MVLRQTQTAALLVALQALPQPELHRGRGRGGEHDQRVGVLAIAVALGAAEAALAQRPLHQLPHRGRPAVETMPSTPYTEPSPSRTASGPRGKRGSAAGLGGLLRRRAPLRRRRARGRTLGRGGRDGGSGNLYRRGGLGSERPFSYFFTVCRCFQRDRKTGLGDTGGPTEPGTYARRGRELWPLLPQRVDVHASAASGPAPPRCES